MMVSRWLGRSRPWAFAAVIFGLFVAEAQAGFTITLDNVTGSGPYTFNYLADTGAGDVIQPGNFFRIYDFYGYVPGSIAAPAGWTVSTELVTPVPPPNVLLTLGDDPAVPNLIFTYNGSTTISGPTTISGFLAVSLYPDLATVKNFVGRSTQADGPTAGQPVDVVGTVRVPTIPEPSSMLSIGIGVLVLLAAGRGRLTA